MNEPERAWQRDDENRDDDKRSDENAEFDRRFSEIVAGFQPAPVDPKSESTGDLGSETSMPPADQHSPVGDSDEPGQRESTPGHQTQSWRAHETEPEDEHFVPAPTEPLPAGDLHFWGIVLGLTIGPVLVFLSAVLSVVPTTPWGVLGVAATTLGFVLLVLRSPRRRAGDDGSGARV